MKANTKNRVKNILFQDYSQLIKKVDEDTISTITGKKLISFSSLTRYLSKLSLQSIPRYILENKRVFGSNVMRHLEELFNNKITDLSQYDFFSESEKLCVMEILRGITNENSKITNVETLITNNKFYGYIDLIIKSTINSKKYKIIEIKTSTSDKLEFRHKLQIAIYVSLLLDNNFGWHLNRPWLLSEVWIYNTNSFKITKHRVSIPEVKRIIIWLNELLELWNLKDYKFEWVKKYDHKTKS